MWDSIFNLFGEAPITATPSSQPPTADRSLNNTSQLDIKGNVGAQLLHSEVQGQTLTLAVTDVCNSHKQLHGEIPSWRSNENAITYAEVSLRVKYGNPSVGMSHVYHTE